jgi:hypothetical protein
LSFDKSAALSTNVASSSKMIFVKLVNKEDSLAEKKVISPQISRGEKGNEGFMCHGHPYKVLAQSDHKRSSIGAVDHDKTTFPECSFSSIAALFGQPLSLYGQQFQKHKFSSCQGVWTTRRLSVWTAVPETQFFVLRKALSKQALNLSGHPVDFMPKMCF